MNYYGWIKAKKTKTNPPDPPHQPDTPNKTRHQTHQTNQTRPGGMREAIESAAPACGELGRVTRHPFKICQTLSENLSLQQPRPFRRATPIRSHFLSKSSKIASQIVSKNRLIFSWVFIDFRDQNGDQNSSKTDKNRSRNVFKSRV